MGSLLLGSEEISNIQIFFPPEKEYCTVLTCRRKTGKLVSLLVVHRQKNWGGGDSTEGRKPYTFYFLKKLHVAFLRNYGEGVLFDSERVSTYFSRLEKQFLFVKNPLPVFLLRILSFFLPCSFAQDFCTGFRHVQMGGIHTWHFLSSEKTTA